MNTRTCCRQATQWIAPGVGLALIPKCPMCVAAYVAMISGVSISLSTATWIRLALIAVCLTALLMLIGRTATRIAAVKPRCRQE